MINFYFGEIGRMDRSVQGMQKRGFRREEESEYKLRSQTGFKLENEGARPASVTVSCWF